eukprot:GHUV01053286.1.p2 GENE.GHUV01053286.1~~GHUV01053286.1.p2  ORF type:complete len:110 (-),score=17.92 GHUV01053286.1:551-880(-)
MGLDKMFRRQLWLTDCMVPNVRLLTVVLPLKKLPRTPRKADMARKPCMQLHVEHGLQKTWSRPLGGGGTQCCAGAGATHVNAPTPSLVLAWCSSLAAGKLMSHSDIVSA